MKNLFVASAVLTAALSVSAAPATVTLSVPSMDCAACPITVKKALTKVNGVSQAKVDFEKRQATVTFEDTKTDVQALALATKNAGYPSTWVAVTK